MSTPISPGNTGAIVSITKAKFEKETTEQLTRIAGRLNRIENQETLIRLKVDEQGKARLKAMPGKLPFLTKIFSGERYAREATHAQRYFGLSQPVTVASAARQAHTLTTPLLEPHDKPFSDKTPTELRAFQEKLAALDGQLKLQFDGKSIRIAHSDTNPRQVDFARQYFGLKQSPTVATVRALLDKPKVSFSATNDTIEIFPENYYHSVDESQEHPVVEADLPHTQAERAFGEFIADQDIANFIAFVKILHEAEEPTAKILGQLAAELCDGVQGKTPAKQYVDDALKRVEDDLRAPLSEPLLAAYDAYSRHNHGKTVIQP